MDVLTRHADFVKWKKDNAYIILLKDESFANTIQDEPFADELLIKIILTARNNKDQSEVKALSEKQRDWKESFEGLVA